MSKRSQMKARTLLWQRMVGVEETMETQEPMDVIEEVPTAHAAVTAPKEETPEQKTPELKALGVVEGTPEKLAMPHFAKALTMHPSKYIDLNSDDDPRSKWWLLDQTQLRLQ